MQNSFTPTQKTVLIAGLGNYGAEYNRTRHNIGFDIVDELARLSNATEWGAKFKGLFANATVSGYKILFLKPQTYMNNSGISVAQCAMFYKVTSQNVIAIHDDIDLESGKIRFKIGGGHGGHNGLKSLDKFISPNYYRFRVGVGRPKFKDDVSNHVLGKMDETEHSSVLKSALELIPMYISVFKS